MQIICILDVDNNKHMKYYFIVLAMLFAVSCCNFSNKRIRADETYEKVKHYDIRYLMYIGMDTYNDQYGKNVLRSIRYYNTKGASLALYPYNSKDVRIFCGKKSIILPQALDIITKITDLQNELNIVNINSAPALGELIIFTCNNAEKLVYCRNTSKVLNPYWKQYLQNDNKLDSVWYLVTTQ
jgi:hypothetical protein